MVLPSGYRLATSNGADAGVSGCHASDGLATTAGRSRAVLVIATSVEPERSAAAGGDGAFVAGLGSSARPGGIDGRRLAEPRFTPRADSTSANRQQELVLVASLVGHPLTRTSNLTPVRRT